MSHLSNKPRSVTWLVVFVLIITGWQWFRFAIILQSWKLLSEMPLSAPTIYFALSSLIWGSLGNALVLALNSGLGWAPSSLRWISAIFVLIYWADKIVLQVGENINNQVFVLLITLISLAIVFWILSRSETRAYFGVHNE